MRSCPPFRHATKPDQALLTDAIPHLHDPLGFLADGGERGARMRAHRLGRDAPGCTRDVTGSDSYALVACPVADDGARPGSASLAVSLVLARSSPCKSLAVARCAAILPLSLEE